MNNASLLITISSSNVTLKFQKVNWLTEMENLPVMPPTEAALQKRTMTNWLHCNALKPDY